MVDAVTAAWTDVTFRAMGSPGRILVDGGGSALGEVLIERIHHLDSVWSRFRANSEVSRLNARTGVPVLVGDDTSILLARAQDAWRLTDGWFDPLMLNELEAAGYDCDHHRLDSVPLDRPPVLGDSSAAAVRESPMSALVIDEELGSVTLPLGSRIDPGGIGKGLAADIVTGEALAAGAHSVLVELGGDLSIAGPWYDGGVWPAQVGHPSDVGRTLAELVVAGGGLATSSRRRRRWRTTDGEAHHLLDPHTGLPSRSALESVTVHAGSAWSAEVIAKAALLAGPTRGRTLVARTRTAALFVDSHGTVEIVGPMPVARLDP